MPNLSRLRPQLITVNQGRAYPLTKPKMVRCEGGGQEVEGADGADRHGPVSRCGNSALIVTRTVVDGKERYFEPVHQRRANPFRRKGAKTVPSNRRIPGVIPAGGTNSHTELEWVDVCSDDSQWNLFRVRRNGL